MADLIDRAALGIGRANPLAFDKPEYAGGWNSAVEIIQNAPTVDAVEVVRCKDCKNRYYNHFQGEFCCEAWADGYDTIVCEDGFCSYGERKET